MKDMRRWLLIAALLAVYGLIFARVGDYDFVWDDLAQLPNNPVFDAPLAQALLATQHDHMNRDFRNLVGAGPRHDSYRPLLFLTFKLEQISVGLNAAALHRHNVAIALLVILVFHMLACRWFESPGLGLAATALFALHPLQVEATAYISARADLLAALFSLLAALSVLRSCDTERTSRGRWGWSLAAGFMALSALLCKESGIGLPLAAAGMAWCLGRLKEARVALVSLTLVSFGVLLLRSIMVGTGAAGEANAALLALPGIFIHYNALSLLPIELSVDRLYEPGLDLIGWLGVVAAAAFLPRVYRNANSRGRSQMRQIGSGLMWAATLMAPTAVVITLLGVVSDRYFFLPLAGWCIAIVAGAHILWCAAPRLRLAMGALACCYLALLALKSFSQLPVWENPRSLAENSFALVPNSSFAAFRLANTYAGDGDIPRALPLFERAVELDPENLRALNNLALSYLNLGRHEVAIATLKEVLRLSRGTHYSAWFNLALAQDAVGQGQLACQSAGNALAVNPNYGIAKAFRSTRCEPATSSE